MAGALAAKDVQVEDRRYRRFWRAAVMEFAVRGFANGVKATEFRREDPLRVIGPAAYDDKAGGKRVTDQLIGAGADVIFGQATGQASAWCRRWRTAKSPAWFIDVIGDRARTMVVACSRR